MRLPSLVTFVFVCCAASNSLSFFSADQHVLDDDLDVPGDNPLEYCQKDNKYSLAIKKVDLTPNPPLPYAKIPLAPCLCIRTRSNQRTVAKL